MAYSAGAVHVGAQASHVGVHSFIIVLELISQHGLQRARPLQAQRRLVWSAHTPTGDHVDHMFKSSETLMLSLKQELQADHEAAK